MSTQIVRSPKTISLPFAKLIENNNKKKWIWGLDYPVIVYTSLMNKRVVNPFKLNKSVTMNKHII